MTDAPARPATSRRIVAIALALVSAAALVWVTFSHRWTASADPLDHSGFGLRSFYFCQDDGCQTVGLREFLHGYPGSVPGAFVTAGWVASIALWLAAAALVLSAGLALAGRFVFRPIAPTSVALLAIAVALIAGCLFVALAPGRPVFGIAYGFFVFGGGVVGGLASSIMLGRLRPHEPEWDAPETFDEANW